MTAVGWKRLPANSHGASCLTCGVFIPAGTPVYWLKRVGIKHEACYEKDAAGSVGKGTVPGSDSESGSGEPYSDSEAQATEGATDTPGASESDPEATDAPWAGEESDSVPDDESGAPNQSEADEGANEEAQQEAESNPPADCPYVRPNSKQAILWRHFDAGGDPQTARTKYGPCVGDGPPWIFTRNTGDGKREPDTLPNQRMKFERVVDDTYREWLKANPERPSIPAPSAQDDDAPEPRPVETAEEIKEAVEEIKEAVEDLPEDSEGQNVRRMVLEFVTEARRIRHSLDALALHETNVDSVSMRAVLDGVRGIIVSRIPAEALLSAIGLHWSPELRSDMQLPTFNVNQYRQEDRRPGEHPAMPYVRDLAAARIPLFIVGGFGVGKSHLAKQLATGLGLEYGECSLSGGISISNLFGNWSPDGYIGRPLPELYRTGGVFCFEEMDAADPNALLSVNTAVANGRLQNPQNGELIYKHEHFIVAACANTYGTGGASRFYTGRERLDMATIDRFRMGRVPFILDESLEDELIEALLAEIGV